MENILSSAKCGIERDGRLIGWIGLNENDVGAARCSDCLKFVYQSRRDTFTPMLGGDSQIIYVDLASFLFML
jgi:hypothetical protein